MAEDSYQGRCIRTLMAGLDHLFEGEQNVAVHGDLFWYPVEGRPGLRTAPDAMVIFGRPKQDRYSYLQWQEGGIAPQVVFEILSHSTRSADLVRKFIFYRQYGVEEYYIHNPEPGRQELSGYVRQGGSLGASLGDNLSGDLVEIPQMRGFVSPRLGIRFEFDEVQGMRIFRPDGEQFLTVAEWIEREGQQRARAEQAERELEILREQLRSVKGDTK